MKFEPITPSDFAAYTATSPYKSFMQTPEIAKYREQNGWTPYYFAVTEDGQIKAATMLVAKPTFLGKSTFIAPGGPLLDLEDAKLVNFFFTHLRRYIKSHNGYTLQISPYYELIARNRNGEPVPGGFNHQKALKNLSNLGFKPLATPDQPKYLFVMDINNRTPDQLFADFKRNTRGHIRKAEKMGVKVRELDREELPILKQITESTSKRRDFTDKPLSYYEQMYDLFHAKGEVKFIVAEAHIEGAADNAVTWTGDAPGGGPPLSVSEVGEEKARQDPSREGIISSSTPLSTSMFILYGDEVVYLFSGSDEKYMKDYNAQYAIQWHMIKYAAKHGFQKYNFYGINGLPDVNSKDYGIYDFKKGFTSATTGHVVELIGTFSLPTNSFFYHLHSSLGKIKKSLKH
ncbi:peptidoglycan bridge formation glycyltransferase FemA/FemB family protein [Candidatus Saccharibacteria bacterium]|nr:peptidoglycan bridge formation glycyltransferase FemA/FemB family protein [Candidatus Saccharibacteria bacterium]